jgi:hypothetical protein
MLIAMAWLVALLDVSSERYMYLLFAACRLRSRGVSVRLLHSSRLAAVYYSNCSSCVCRF